MSSTFRKGDLERFRKDHWPHCHDEFDNWPRHMRPPMHMRSMALAFDPITMTVISLAGTAISTGIGAAGTIAAGQNAQAMGRYQQAQYAQQAENSTATAQRSAQEDRRQTGLVQSKLQALSAAQGGSATDPSVLKLSGDIAGRGEYKALMDLSSGEDQAAGLTNMGAAAKYGGDLAKQGDELSAAGTIASGIGSFASNYRTGLGKTAPYGGPNPVYG
jgi:hypothetical protein